MMQLPLHELQQSDAPMTDILNQHSTQAGKVISIISLVAVVNGALVQIIMGSRVLYGMAKQGLAPAGLSKVHRTFKTPVIATVIVSAVIWVLAVALPLVTLAKITSFIIITVFLIVNIYLIKLLRQENSVPEKAMKVKAWVPYAATFMCLFFLGVQLLQLYNSNFSGH
jgi:amino acid transporter